MLKIEDTFCVWELMPESYGGEGEAKSQEGREKVGPTPPTAHAHAVYIPNSSSIQSSDLLT